jgi:hypothetical protein
MTAGNNDDPFAYLYRPDGGEGDADGDAAQSRTAAQPGVPRTSYHQVRRVGERRPAPQQQTGGYGYPQQQSGGYGYPPQQPSQYAQQPPATQAIPQQGGQGGPGGYGDQDGPPGRGPNSRGLLIGAVAVVAAVAIGIGVAIVNGDDGADTAAGGNTTPTAGASKSPGGSAQKGHSSSPPAASGELPGTKDAATLDLAGGAAVAGDVKGAEASDGKYVAGMEAVGASASWTFDSPEKGEHTLFVSYSVPGSDADSTITVNGEKQSRPLSMKNFAHAPGGDYAKGWTQTYAFINLRKGENTVSISCEAGNTCDFLLDQVWLKNGQATG